MLTGGFDRHSGAGEQKTARTLHLRSSRMRTAVAICYSQFSLDELPGSLKTLRSIRQRKSNIVSGSQRAIFGNAMSNMSIRTMITMKGMTPRTISSKCFLFVIACMT